MSGKGGNPNHDPATGEFTTGGSGAKISKITGKPFVLTPRTEHRDGTEVGLAEMKRFGKMSRREKAQLGSKAQFTGTTQSIARGRIVSESSRVKPAKVLGDERLTTDVRRGWAGEGRVGLKSPLPGRSSTKLAASGDQIPFKKLSAREQRRRLEAAQQPPSRADQAAIGAEKSRPLNFYARHESPAAVAIQTSKALERDFQAKKERDATASIEDAIRNYSGGVTKLPSGKARATRKPLLKTKGK